jgi:subtilase family serine protease
VTGATTATNLQLRAVLDGSVVWCSFSSSVVSGGYFAWCNSPWTATAGTHTLRWDLDYNNLVPEANESNNSVTKTFTVAPSSSVDLVAVRAYFKTAASGGTEVITPVVGQSVYPFVDVQVTAPGSTTFDVREVLDGIAICAGPLTLTPGSWMVNCPVWTATAGSHTLRWDLDYNNTVAETNESNNSATKTFTTTSSATNTGVPLSSVAPPNVSLGPGVPVAQPIPESTPALGGGSAIRRPDGL